MQISLRGLTTLSLLASLTACGRSDQESKPQQTASLRLEANHRKVVPLTAGEYLVKISHNSCESDQLTVKQHWEYPDPTEAINPVIELSVALKSEEPTKSSVACKQTQNVGWTMIRVSGDAGVTADWGSEVLGVERIETESPQVGRTQIILDAGTPYVVDLEISKKCRDQNATIRGEYQINTQPGRVKSFDKKVFTDALPVTDNLFHRAICQTPSSYYATDFIHTSERNMLLIGSDSLGHLGKISARRITTRSKIYDANKTIETSHKTISDIEITGHDGTRLMEALVQLGVVDSEPMIGATNLSISELRCDRDTSRDERGVVCRYKGVHSTTQTPELRSGVTGTSAETIFKTLESYGASIPAGINPNYNAVGAKRVSCSQPVVPNPVATCIVTP